MATGVAASRRFKSLSVRDLIEAREAYHVHLAHLDRVVATAIGLYRVRTSRTDRGPKRLDNTRVERWSWPCVYVFVDTWKTSKELATEPDQLVPSRLYMPDGRVVPTCVLLAPPSDEPDGETYPRYPVTGPLRGGMPLRASVQGTDHVATIGCLAARGDVTFALTSEHVAGEPGREIDTSVGGSDVLVGRAEDGGTGKIPFSDAYPGWPGEAVLLNADVGLVRLDDVRGWSWELEGVGEFDEPLDLDTFSISLDLVGQKVLATGAVSGPMRGEIVALFYRYRSLGGVDHVADVLVGAADGGTSTAPFSQRGDSGALWLLPAGSDVVDGGARQSAGIERPTPLALQWGGHTTRVGGERRTFRFALATFVSTALRALNATLVRDGHSGEPNTWGPTGHYTIAARACSLPKTAKLKKLMEANRHLLSPQATTPPGLQPLADVPDNVWKGGVKRPEVDNPTHFADLDQPAKKGKYKGKTLAQFCDADPKNISPAAWEAFVEAAGESVAKQGTLPFRVWQHFDEMVASLQAGNLARFVAAAGTVAHYMGDACQPLHTTFKFNGDTSKKPTLGAGVHSPFESKMLDGQKPKFMAKVDGALLGGKIGALYSTGHEAARAVIALTVAVRAVLTPDDIIAAYVKHGSKNKYLDLWKALGDRTAKVVALGCYALATLWESAWKEGGGSAKFAEQDLRAQDDAAIKRIYTFSKTPDFVPSLSLGTMASRKDLFPDPV